MGTKKQFILSDTCIDTIDNFISTKNASTFPAKVNEIIETFHYQVIYTKNEIKGRFDEEDIKLLSQVLLGSVYGNIPLPKTFISSLIDSYKILNSAIDESKFSKLEDKLKKLDEFQAYVLILMCFEHNFGGNSNNCTDNGEVSENTKTVSSLNDDVSVETGDL